MICFATRLVAYTNMVGIQAEMCAPLWRNISILYCMYISAMDPTTTSCPKDTKHIKLLWRNKLNKALLAGMNQT